MCGISHVFCHIKRLKKVFIPQVWWGVAMCFTSGTAMRIG